MPNAPRNSRNNTRSGRSASHAQLRALESRLNPNVVGRPAKSQPRPVVGPGDFWVTRRIQVLKASSAAQGAALEFTLGDIATQLTNNTNSTGFRVSKVCVWGPATYLITAQLNLANISNNVGSQSSNNGITCTDFGTTNNLPGVEFKIPKLIALYLWSSKATTTSVLTIPNAIKDLQYVMDVTLDFQPA